MVTDRLSRGDHYSASLIRIAELPAVDAPIPLKRRKLSRDGAAPMMSARRAHTATALSEQSASHGKRNEPHQPGKTQTAEHGGRAEILNAPDLAVLLACHMIGEFFDPSVEEFYGEHDEQGAYHGGIPGAARGNNQAQQEPDADQNRIIAQRRLGLKAVDQSADRILRSAVQTFHV
jgi:hypothetical protein